MGTLHKIVTEYNQYFDSHDLMKSDFKIMRGWFKRGDYICISYAEFDTIFVSLERFNKHYYSLTLFTKQAIYITRDDYNSVTEALIKLSTLYNVIEKYKGRTY